jgi:hypothetical protein
MELAERARQRDIRLVNPPEALSNSRKSIQGRLWQMAGIPTPPQYEYASEIELRRVAREIRFPAVMRAELLHSQQSVHWLDSRQALEALASTEIPFPGCLAPFVDSREWYRRTAPGTPWAEFYHKKRNFVFGTHVRNNHVFFSDSPIVASKSSTFGHHRSLNPIHRLRENRRCSEHIALDLEYFRAEPEQPALFVRAAQVLGLEFVAFDYSTLADGTVMIWEANPHFTLHQWPIEILPRLRRLRERIEAYHDTMREFFLDLLEAP